MKVLVFTSLYPNHIWSHHGVFVKERMTHFARLDGCQVQVVAPVPYFPPVKIGQRWLFSQVHRQELIEGLTVYHPRYLITPKVGMTSYGLTMFLSALSAVKKLQKSFDFDLIDAHFVYPDGLAAVLLGKCLRKPVVISARGSDINRYGKFPVIRQLLRYALRQADKVIAVSHALRESIMQLGIPSQRIAVIPNGVDVVKFSPVPKAEARRKLALPPNPLLLSVGGLTAVKRFDALLKALKILVDKFSRPDLSLAIVGEGPLRPALGRLITELHLEAHVRLVGDVPHQELPWWYSAADLFCLVSSHEGWPNVLLESLACGTPVVATRVGGIPEVIRCECLGLLTEPDQQAIAACVFRALRTVWEPHTLIQYARTQTWQRAARSLLHTFTAVLQAHNAPPLAYPNPSCHTES